jgi:hypothetical protein
MSHLASGQPITVLAASGTAVSGAADTSENILATVSLPAGIMGANGVLRIWTLWNYTSSSNNKTLRIRLGGIGGTQVYALLRTTSTHTSDLRFVANANAQNAQVFFDRGSEPTAGAGSSGTNITAVIDTSAATTLVITGQKASAGETLTLSAYTVELLKT